MVLSMPAVEVVHPPGFAAERAYVARVLLGPDADVREGPVSQWELRAGERKVEVPDVFFRTTEWLRPGSLPDDGTLYGDDLLGNAFFVLTRYEEAVLPDRDEHDRFPAASSILVRGGLIERPVVDEWAEQLRRALGLEPPPHHFRVVPSHDVDYPFASLRLRASALRHGGWRAALPRDPFDTFDLLMNEAERRGLRAAFYVIPDGSIYSLDDPRVRDLLRKVHRRGHELGFHAGLGTFRDPEAVRRQFERLVAVCAEEGIHQDSWGGRQHFLQWEPGTWAAWDAAGLAYDSTVGFSAQPGFRAGTCHEYPVFDLQAGRELRLRERPLVLMDTPTLDRLHLTDAELGALIERLRGECRRAAGDFTVLWHNNWLVTSRQRRLLQAALG
jgi:hypothetical protein